MLSFQKKIKRKKTKRSASVTGSQKDPLPPFKHSLEDTFLSGLNSLQQTQDWLVILQNLHEAPVPPAPFQQAEEAYCSVPVKLLDTSSINPAVRRLPDRVRPSLGN